MYMWGNEDKDRQGHTFAITTCNWFASKADDILFHTRKNITPNASIATIVTYSPVTTEDGHSEHSNTDDLE